MMEFTNAMTINLLLIANAALLAAAAIAIVRFRKQARRFEKFWDSPTGTTPADTQARDAKIAPQPNPQFEKRIAELQSVVWTLARKEQVIREPVDLTESRVCQIHGQAMVRLRSAVAKW